MVPVILFDEVLETLRSAVQETWLLRLAREDPFPLAVCSRPIAHPIAMFAGCRFSNSGHGR